MNVFEKITQMAQGQSIVLTEAETRQLLYRKFPLPREPYEMVSICAVYGISVDVDPETLACVVRRNANA